MIIRAFILIIFVLILIGLVIAIMFDAKVDVTKEGEVLLWYSIRDDDGDVKRKFKKLFQL